MHWTGRLPVVGYNVTRPFPFRWFTVFLFLEFVIATVLFSLISLVTSGYQLASYYSPDPNSTVTERNIRGVPDFLLRIKPTCQPIEISVGESFSTNNSALSYVVNHVKQQDTISPSFAYRQNLFTDCKIEDILILIDTPTRNAAQLAFMDYGADVRASVNCSLIADGVPTILDIVATYNYVPTTVTIGSGLTAFPGRNRSTKASLFWGEELLAFYWSVMVNTYRNEFVSGKVFGAGVYVKAALYFTPNSVSRDDINSVGFFTATQRMYSSRADGTPFTLWNGEVSMNATELSTGKYSRQTFWLYADKLAKAFHSTVMTDLGQKDARPNILIDPVLLQTFTAEIPQVRSTLGRLENHNLGLLLNPSSRVQDNFDSLKQKSGDLAVTSSVISARYLCQIPQLKSTENLIISFLITNIVLLQTLWAVTMWVATWLTNRQDRNSSYCMRCASSRNEDAMELTRNPKKSTYSMISDQEPEEIRGLISPRVKHKPYLGHRRDDSDV